MAQSLFIEKREWTKDELMSAQKIFCDNDLAREAISFIFDCNAESNAAGELVFDCGKELDAFSMLMNMLGEYFASFFEGFLLERGGDPGEHWHEHRNELHRRLTDMFTQMYHYHKKS